MLLMFEAANLRCPRCSAIRRTSVSTGTRTGHLAFGFGTPFCLGNQLARLELSTMGARFSSVCRTCGSPTSPRCRCGRPTRQRPRGDAGGVLAVATGAGVGATRATVTPEPRPAPSVTLVRRSVRSQVFEYSRFWENDPIPA